MNSDVLKDNIQQNVILNISREFSDFLSCDECPLKDMQLFSNFENLEEIDLTCILNKCKKLAGSLLKSLFIICFGNENWDEMLDKTRNMKSKDC